LEKAEKMCVNRWSPIGTLFLISVLQSYYDFVFSKGVAFIKKTLIDLDKHSLMSRRLYVLARQWARIIHV